MKFPWVSLGFGSTLTLAGAGLLLAAGVAGFLGTWFVALYTLGAGAVLLNVGLYLVVGSLSKLKYLR